ncbi:PTS sugar transporter subunit IIC [Spiroplasma endosymbiont of Crioceris asparagi]|uniref:PTS sugar transporter subunit IIC n=1 Tax=Spiroplasma endosymbiont of Crioceris asparagi TaxID=3066286 RepID=UPI0030CFB03F
MEKEFRSKERGSFIQNKLVPFMGKLGQQRHLGAIRDAFATLIPLIIAGSIGTLINAIGFGGAGSGYVSILGLICKIAHPDLTNAQISELISSGIVKVGDTTILNEIAWHKVSTIFGLALGHISTATIGMISIYFSFLFGYFLSLSKNFAEPIIAGLLSTAALVLSALGSVSFVQGAPGLITAILITIFTTEVFVKLTQVKALLIKLPDGVPPAVGKSFSVFLPSVLTLMCVSGLVMLVFGPAMIWQTWHVQAGENFSQSFEDMKGFQDWLAGLPSLPKPDAMPSWWNNEIWNNFSHQSSLDGVNDYIKSLSSHDQSILSSMISFAAGKTNNSGNGMGAILNPGSSSIIKAVLTHGHLILSMNYQKITTDYTGFGLAQAIYQFFTTPFLGFATGNGSIGIALVYVFFVSVFWLFGIHGTNLLMGIFTPIFTMIVLMNQDLVNAAGSYDAAKASGQMGIFGSPFFDSFVFIGGAGCTLTLLVATFIFSKRQDLKEIAKYATPAGCFQINEPVMFGFPIVLNPIYAIPFIFTQVANLFVAWFFIKVNLVKMPTIMAAPWTTPWFIGGVISTIDYRALIPAFINFGIDLLIYIPFVLVDNKVYFSKLKETSVEAYEQEMRYYDDPEFRFNVITDRKIAGLEEKATTVMSNAMYNNEFLAKRFTDAEKIAKLQAENNAKAEVKKEVILKELEKLKADRAAKALKLKPKWDAYMQKKATKAAQKHQL